MVDIRLCSSVDELRAGITPIWHYFGRQPVDDHLHALQRVLPLDRVHLASEDGDIVGAAGSFPLELTVPGGRVSAAGVTIVAVLPTHRRRGILRRLMRAQLDACRKRGEPVAYLWATEDTIYDRFGYGLASLSADIDLQRDRSKFYNAVQRPVHTALLSLKDAQTRIAPIYDRVAQARPGMFRRNRDWWEARTLADPPWRRGNAGELQCAVLELDSGAAAYALYRLTPGFDRGVQTGTIHVAEAIGTSPEATQAVWRYVCEIDLMARVTASLLPVDHPLLLLIAEPRRLRFTLRDGVWVRLVDVKGALSTRSYAPGKSVVVEVCDEFCEWNNGNWRIGAEGIERTAAPADIRCNISVLCSAYLGGFTWTRLSEALRLEELRPGAAECADAIFQSRSAPWCPEIF